MRNKKAIILPETLKIIIGVLCIILLVYLAFSLYSLFIVKSKLVQARSTFREIVSKVQGLGEEEEIYQANSPKGWVLVSQENRLCMCNAEDIKKCCEKGVSEYVYNVNVEGFCLIKKTFRYYPYLNCIYFKNLPFYIYLGKSGNSINIIANKLTGILKELLEHKEGDKTVLELIKLKIKPSGITGKDKEELKNIISKFFAGKGILYRLEIMSKGSPLTTQTVFLSRNVNIRELQGGKELIYEFIVREGTKDKFYELNLKYKEK